MLWPELLGENGVKGGGDLIPGDGRSAALRDGEARAWPCEASLSKNSTKRFEKDCMTQYSDHPWSRPSTTQVTHLVHGGFLLCRPLGVFVTALPADRRCFALSHFLQARLFALRVVPG